MNPSEGRVEKIIAALNAKIPDSKCPLCGTNSWAVQDGFVLFPVQTNSRQFAGQSMVCAAIVCMNCGNTQFINLQILDPTIQV